MSKNKKVFWLVLICTALISLLVIYSGVKATQEINNTHSSWDSYLQNKKKIDLTLNNLQAILGYGGFIHDFKNATIRRDKEKYLLAKQKIKKAFFLIDQYQSFNISKDESLSLIAIKSVLKEYEINLEKLRVLIYRPKTDNQYSIKKADKAIKVDDTPAINALEVLALASQKRAETQESAVDSAISKVITSIYNIGIIIPLILIICTGFILFALKLSQYNKRIRDSRRFYNKLFESSPDAILLVSDQGKITKVNNIACELTGYSRQQLKTMSIEDLLPHKYRNHHHGLRSSYFNNPKRREMKGGTDLSLLHREGFEVPVDIGLNYLQLGQSRFAITSLRDVSSKKKAKQSLQKAAAVFENISDAVLIADKDKKITSVNKAFEDITGYSPDEVIGLNPGFAKSGRHNSDFYKRMHKDLIEHGLWQGEIWDRRKNGSIYPKWLNIKHISDDNEGYYIGIFSDISKRKEAENQLRHLAFHDPLTSLLNRNAFMERLGHAIQFSRHLEKMLGVIFIDLDYFKKLMIA